MASIGALSRLFARDLFQRSSHATAARTFSVGKISFNSDKSPSQLKVVPLISFSSSGNFQNFMKSPNLEVIASVLLAGNANGALFASRGNFDYDEFREGALQAIDVASESLANQDLGAIGDVVTSDCLENLAKVSDIADGDRESLHIAKRDVYFSWIHMKNDESVTLGTMSMPGYDEILEELKANAKLIEAFQHQLKEEQADAQTAVDRMNELRNSLTNPGIIFRDQDFLVSNFRFVKRDNEWAIDSIAMKPGRGLFNAFYYFRWKGRLGFVLRGFKFLNILRYDYASDLICLMAFSLLFSSRTVS